MSNPVMRHRIAKVRLNDFLAHNPFPRPWTLGFFYREKMRAIHAIAPAYIDGPVAEIGGGESGLTTLLYPTAQVFNIEIDSKLAAAAPNRQKNMVFVCGDATRLPFPDNFFGAVTMFDLIEHVVRDDVVAAEALRVLRPGGCILLSTPNLRWRYPFYNFYSRLCPAEGYLTSLWGHVRRGYAETTLNGLFKGRPDCTSSFINNLTVISHDLSFSLLPHRVRILACMMLWPITLLGYAMPYLPGTEIAARWTRRMEETPAIDQGT